MKKPGKPTKPPIPKEPSKFKDWEFKVSIDHYRDIPVFDLMDIFLSKMVFGNFKSSSEEIKRFIINNPERLTLTFECYYDEINVYLTYNIKADDELIPNEKFVDEYKKYSIKILEYPAKYEEYEKKLKIWQNDHAAYIEFMRNKKEYLIAKLKKEIDDLR